MAKKPTRSGRPQPGGRVTPKGARSDEHSTSAGGQTSRPDTGAARAPAGRGNSHGYAAPHVPTRSGHHRGNR